MSRLAGVRAISFDADNTLYDFNKVMRHSLEVVLAHLVGRYPDAKRSLDIEALIRVREEVFQAMRGKEVSLEAIRLEAFRETLRRIGHPDDAFAEEINETYLRHRFEDVELYPDVLPALRQLGERCTIGLLSNGNSYPEKCGLAGIFKFVVFSQDHGVEKPDPRIFAIALEKAGCRKDEMVHVGDSLNDDVAGAAAAGVRSAWVNREGGKPGAGVKPDIEIASLAELPGLL